MADDAAHHYNVNDDDTATTFDYVVIGSGPPCAGLIWGLLLQQQLRAAGDEAGSGGRGAPSSWSSSSPTIAVVERGPIINSGTGTGTGTGTGNGTYEDDKAPSSDVVSSSPVHWFRSSHDPCHVHTALHNGTVNVFMGSGDAAGARRRGHGDVDGPSKTSTDPRSSCPSHGSAWQRVLDVPVGRGWGGTSLINACLCQLPRPEDFSEWPEPFRSQMMDACHAVRHQLQRNGCLLQWNKDRTTVKADDGDDGSTIELTVMKKACHLSSVDDNNNDDDTNAFTDRCSDVDPSSFEYRRCSYWEGLLGGPSSQQVVHKDSTDDVWTRFRRHVHVIQGQAERLLVAENDQDGDVVVSDRLSSTLTGTSHRQRRRVVGVEISCGIEPDGSSSYYRILRARKDVILCAGTIETPTLLLVSGIGGGNRTGDGPQSSRDVVPPPPLLPVGVGLRDHVALSRAIWTRRRTTNASAATVNGVASLRTIQVGQSIFQVGVLDGPDYPSILPTVVSGWFRGTLARLHGESRASRGRPLVRDVGMALFVYAMAMIRCLVKYLLSVLLMLPKYSPIVWLLRNRVVTVTVFHMNPTSTGRVAIRHKPKSASRDETTSVRPPLRRRDVELDIHLGYLESKEDVDAMHTGWIASQSLLEEMGVDGVEIFPGFAIRKWSLPFRQLGRNPFRSLPDMDRFRFFARCTCLPYFHWSGSCRMATDDAPNGVVGPDLKVRGYEGLRICDASVFPTHVSAPTALTCAALGYVFGHDVLNKGDDT